MDLEGFQADGASKLTARLGDFFGLYSVEHQHVGLGLLTRTMCTRVSSKNALKARQRHACAASP